MVYPWGFESPPGKFDKKTGITSIKKNMVSLDGTRTDYLYENDENGNRISDYKITDITIQILLLQELQHRFLRCILF